MSDAWLLGIEIGGTKLQLGIGQGDGHILGLERLRVEPSRGALGIRQQIQAAFPALLARTKLTNSDVKAVGVGFGGPVDALTGRTRKSFQIEGWDDFPLAGWIAEHLDIPVVVVENDADTAGLAESRFGSGVGRSPLLYMNVGSGIGGALIVDQQIYHGIGQGAIEIGHLRVPDRTGLETRIADLEQVASGWAIASAAQAIGRHKIKQSRGDWSVLARAQGDPDAITGALVAEAALAGDPDSLALFERARTAVAFALAQAITLLAPRRIVMGGGVSLVGDELWLDPIRRLTNQDVFEPFRGSYEIVPAALGEEVVVHGALALARYAVSTSRSQE